MNNKIVIVDGNSLINRAFFAMSDLKNSKGVYTGGAYGLINMVLNLMDQFNPSHFCVAFDMKGPTKRHETYEAYKGTRKGMPEELAMQMPIVKELLDALKIPRIELQGYEADDLIGTISKAGVENDFDVHVITGDKDALQLVAFGANVHITKKGITELKRYSDEDIMEELGVHSNQVIDFKGLSGDSSDNIPGIPGVGPKTASKLLATFESVENLIDNYDQIENKRIRGLVESYRDQAMLSKRLATIFLDVPIDLEFDFFKLKSPDTQEVVEVLRHYELSNLLNKFQSREEVHLELDLTGSEHLTMDEIKVRLEKSKSFFMKLYAEPDQRTINCAAFASENEILIAKDPSNIAAIKTLIEDKSVEISGFDLKSDMLILLNNGIEVKGVSFDGYIASHLLDPSRRNYNLSELFFEYTSKTIQAEEDLLGKGAKKKTYGEINADDLKDFATGEIQAIIELNSLLKEKITDSNLENLLYNVELPLVQILADMEHTGFKVDVEQVDLIDQQLIEKLNTIESNIYDMAGEKFNINSPKQLGVILFEKLELPVGKKTKTGYSTSHDVLEKLSGKHAIISEILEYRTYAKLKSTYIDGLRNVIDSKTNRVHTSLNQTVTMTGRLSSTEPNLQNIPIRLPYGRKIRRFFIPDPGCILLDADYSQIELRILAHLSEDPKLIEAFKENLDIHTITASQVFGIDESEVTSLQRSRAKEVNFGIIYGMGDFGLSESLGISRKEAKAYIENYFRSYPSVEGFMNGIIDVCKKNGYVETILGRRRTIPDIDSKNFMLRSAAERIARNTPIQGSAADVIKLAMIKVSEALMENKLKSKLILQVHDELILNVPMEELDQVKKILKENMENAIALKVPLKVDMSTGESWYEAK